MQPKTYSSAHANNFDLLRVIFALMVVFFHIGLLSQSPALSWMPKYISSTFAVQAFFVVSGYLVIMSFENSATLGEYWKKRICRIAPAYIFVVVSTAVLLCLVSTSSLLTYFTSLELWQYIVFNLLLANFKAPALPNVFSGQFENAVNVSLWTIKIEFFFYACVPFIVWLIRKWGYQKVLLAIFLMSILWRNIFYYHAVVNSSEIYFKLAKQLPGQLAFFAGGAWIYYKRRNGFRLSWKYALLGIIAYYFARGWVFETIAPAAVTMLVGWSAVSIPRILDVGKYGDFSFGLYLYHAPVVQSLIALGYFAASASTATAFTVLITTTLAILSWNFIEKPFLQRSKIPT